MTWQKVELPGVIKTKKEYLWKLDHLLNLCVKNAGLSKEKEKLWLFAQRVKNINKFKANKENNAKLRGN